VDSVDTWRVDQILTELFDLSTTYKPKVERLMRRHEELLIKRNEQKLSKEEEQEYEQLTRWRRENIPPPIEDPGLRRTAQVIQRALARHQPALKELQ
jgi:hypothetical protein